MKKSFIMGNILLVIGSIITAAGIIAAPNAVAATTTEFNSYHLVGLGLGIALMVIGALVLILNYVISFANEKMSKKACAAEVKTEVKAEPEVKAVEVKPAEVKVEAEKAPAKKPVAKAPAKTAAKPAATKTAAKTTAKKK